MPASTVGQGTTFTIDLPILKQSQEKRSGAPDGGAEPPPAQERCAARLLLVVDEEPSALEPLCGALRNEGHQVETSSNGQAGLRKILDGSYDAVIIDLELPGLSGEDLFNEARRIHPALADRFVFAVGKPVSDDAQAFLKQDGRLSVGKPFNLGEVIALVDQVLAGIS